MEPEELWRCDAIRRLREAQLTGMKPGYCKEFTCWTGMTSTWVANGEDLELRSQGFTQHVPKPGNVLTFDADTRADDMGAENTTNNTKPRGSLPSKLMQASRRYGKTILDRLS